VDDCAPYHQPQVSTCSVGRPTWDMILFLLWRRPYVNQMTKTWWLMLQLQLFWPWFFQGLGEPCRKAQSSIASFVLASSNLQ
jgi:hypothetical protein